MLKSGAPLIGSNRKYFEERLAARLSFAISHDTNLSVIILDLDHFKGVNDMFGHLAGDTVLQIVARVLSQELPAEAMVARYGGDEFVVLSRAIDLVTGTLLADQIRSRIAATPIDLASLRIHVTASAGVASLACCGPNRDQATLLGLADRRVDHAKQTGRNRVVNA